MTDLLPVLKGEGFGEVWSYIPSFGVQLRARSRACYPYPAHSGAQGYGFPKPKEHRTYKPYHTIPALKDKTFEIVSEYIRDLVRRSIEVEGDG